MPLYHALFFFPVLILAGSIKNLVCCAAHGAGHWGSGAVSLIHSCLSRTWSSTCISHSCGSHGSQEDAPHLRERA